MSRTSSTVHESPAPATSESSADETVAPIDAFADVEFKTPILRLAMQLLRPHLRHALTACTAEQCRCGLREAVAELTRREMLFHRYGSLDE